MQLALAEWTGQRTVPNVFIGGKHIGGCDSKKLLFLLRSFYPKNYFFFFQHSSFMHIRTFIMVEKTLDWVILRGSLSDLKFSLAFVPLNVSNFSPNIVAEEKQKKKPLLSCIRLKSMWLTSRPMSQFAYLIFSLHYLLCIFLPSSMTMK